jgi:hypothetical protein
MSATPIRNLVLAAVLVGFSTMALGNGQFDNIVSRAASNFAIANTETGSDAPAYSHDASYGMWSFEFE